MRLIDAHKLLDYIEMNKDTVDIVDIVESIIMSPTVDAVPVIRCKDCKWKHGSECVRFAEVRPFPDDFCSRAERKDDEIEE